MTTARRKQICLDSTTYYHCIARCVRRAFLCGKDNFSGNNYEHRRQWVVDRLKELTTIFVMDIPAYAVMSNHYHVILRVDLDCLAAFTDREVIDRWTTLFRGPVLIQRMLAGDNLTKAEKDVIDTIVAEWRKRLGDISWFMRCLNEYLARKANEEDRCKGRFWEGRFKSQALLDEQAVLSCMAYVDLNPVRANMAKTPEASDYTAIQERLVAAATALNISHLTPFTGNQNKIKAVTAGIHFHFDDYLALVDWTGRALRQDKRGAIPNTLPPILDRLSIDADSWLKNVKGFSGGAKAIGAQDKIKSYLHELGQKWIRSSNIISEYPA